MKGVPKSELPRRVRRHGEFLYRELYANYPAVLRMSANGVRQVGFKTRHERGVYYKAALTRLCALGYFVPHVRLLKAKHIRALCEDMEERELRPPTIATDASFLTVLFRGIGKPHLVENIDGYFSSPAVLRRSGVASRDKTLEGAGIEFAFIYQRAMAVDPRIACMLELCYEFGLRVREAWLFRPHLAVRDGVICVYWGAKGGRKRELPFELSPSRVELMERAKSFAATPAESMIPRSISLKKWRSRWQRAMTKIGLTRTQLGVTPHALRHSAQCRYYKQVSAHEPAIRGGDLHKTDAHADRAARDLVADLAGHSRRSVSGAYLGGVRPRSP